VDESEVRLNKKIERIQAQINALSSELRKLYRVVTHPSTKTYVNKITVLKTETGDIVGTANQVVVSNGTNVTANNKDVTLSLPQSIHTGATPEFAGLKLTGNSNILGNYYIRWRDASDSTTYCYVIGGAGGVVFSIVNVPFQLQYGTLGASVALSMDSAGNVIWNYDAEDCDFSIFKETAGVAYGYDAGGDTHTFSGIINLDLPVYANNAAAIVGGLAAGDLYRTNGDPDTVCIVH